MKKIDRRTALKSMGGFALGAGLLRCGEDERPLSETIDTVVVLMLENRSFDHFFGARSLLEGRVVDGLTAQMSNPRLTGEPVFVHPADRFCIADPPHHWETQHEAFAGGANDGFVRTHELRRGLAEGARVMGYFDRETLPVSYALADNYTLCDRWFCSLMTSTWPNRFYMHAAQNGGYRSNDLDGDYDFPYVYDQLLAAGRTFSTYYNNLSFNFLIPRDYPDHCFRPFEQFYEDAAAGVLPNFTVVEPMYGRNCDHPPAHPKAGQLFIATVYEALARSPQWDRSLLLVTYDENGGFFDHVAPPEVPDLRASAGFGQLGFRVPSLVVGPYAKTNHVSSTLTEHASIVALLGRLFGLPALTVRDANASDLTTTLDLERVRARAPRRPAVIPRVEANEAEIYASDCVSTLSFLVDRGATGQAELEAFVRQNPRLAALDRRQHADRNYETWLAHAERRGLLRRVGGRIN